MDVVMIAVRQDGMALEHASKTLKNNKQVVLAAVNQNRNAFQFASAALMNDEKFAAVVESEHWRDRKEKEKEKEKKRRRLK